MTTQNNPSYAAEPKSIKIPPVYLYLFSEGDGKNKKLLGGKGAGLCEMTQIGLPVPPGFVITTQACLEYFDGGFKLPEGLKDQVRQAMSQAGEINELGLW